MSIKSKMRKTTAAMIIVSIIQLLCTFLLSYSSLSKVGNSLFVNKERLDTNIIVNTIERNFSGLQQGQSSIREELRRQAGEAKLELLIIDGSGRVLFDSQAENGGVKNNTESIVDIKEAVGYDKSFHINRPGYIRFAVPLVIEGVQAGNVVFVVRSDKGSLVMRSILLTMLPVFIGLIFILILVLKINEKMYKEVLEPIKELNTAADRIAAGNFDNKIKYNDTSELGSFCSSFEFMRDELRASLERQESLERSRKELVACISHDLRTPIASIRAYAEGLRDGLAKSPDTAARYASVISKKSEALSKLINDLFEHSQAELGELKLELKECYSREVLSKIVEPFELEAREQGLDFHIEGQLPDVLIKVDPLRIEQVIMNLMQNAKKYTPSGGSIYFSAESEERYIKITVRDTGMGISQRDLPFIFERFYRGEKSRSRDFGGAGLGLAICKYIVQAHGGTISAESRENEGSSFTFTIPKL